MRSKPSAEASEIPAAFRNEGPDAEAKTLYMTMGAHTMYYLRLFYQHNHDRPNSAPLLDTATPADASGL